MCAFARGFCGGEKKTGVGVCGFFASVDICLSLAASAVNAAGGGRDFGVGLGRYRLIFKSLGWKDDFLEGGDVWVSYWGVLEFFV